MSIMIKRFIVFLIFFIVLGFLTVLLTINTRTEVPVSGNGVSPFICQVIGAEKVTVTEKGWPLQSIEVRENVCVGRATSTFIPGIMVDLGVAAVASLLLMITLSKLQLSKIMR